MFSKRFLSPGVSMKILFAIIAVGAALHSTGASAASCYGTLDFTNYWMPGKNPDACAAHRQEILDMATSLANDANTNFSGGYQKVEVEKTETLDKQVHSHHPGDKYFQCGGFFSTTMEIAFDEPPAGNISPPKSICEMLVDKFKASPDFQLKKEDITHSRAAFQEPNDVPRGEIKPANGAVEEDKSTPASGTRPAE